MKVMFFWKKKPPAGLHHTEDRIGNTPDPDIQFKPPISNQNPSKHRNIESKRSAAEAAACKLGWPRGPWALPWSTAPVYPSFWAGLSAGVPWGKFDEKSLENL